MSRRWQQWVGYVYLIILLIPLFLHAYTGSFIRFVADDFCSAVIARNNGLLGGAWNWYLTWSGRFSANFLDSLVGTIGPAVTPYIPSLAILLWFLALMAAVLQLLPGSENKQKFLIAGIISSLVLFCVCEMSPNIAQSLYWEQGMHSVVPPLILATVIFGLTVRRATASSSAAGSIVYACASGALAFLAGGFSETYVAVQTLVFTVLILTGLALNPQGFKKRLLLFAAAGLAGSILAMFLVILAPGNHVRQAASPPPPGFFDLVKITALSAFRFLENIIVSKRHLLTAIVLFSISALLGAGFLQEARLSFPAILRNGRSLLILPLAAAAMQLACFAPAAFGLSGPPPDRTMIIPVFALVCTICYFGVLTGQFAAERIILSNPLTVRLLVLSLAAAAGCLMILVVFWNSYKTISLLPTLQAYSRDWDRQDQILREAKAQEMTEIVVAPMHNGIGLDDIGPDSTTWFNQCVSGYYGLTVTTNR